MLVVLLLLLLQWMLVTVVVLFLVTELPQGLLSVCSGVVDGCFEAYYSPLGDTMDIAALTNNAINFALYCTMSARFRLTFTRLFALSSKAAASSNKKPRASADISVAMTSEPRFSCSRISVTECSNVNSYT